MSQPIIQGPDGPRDTDLGDYAPRKYSAGETVVTTIKLFAVIGLLITLAWVADLVFKA